MAGTGETDSLVEESRFEPSVPPAKEELDFNKWLNLRWRDLDFTDADLVFDDRPAPQAAARVPPDHTPRFCWWGMW